MPHTEAFSPIQFAWRSRRWRSTRILAALAITLFKVIVGVTTGSLGILSEAAHWDWPGRRRGDHVSVQVSDKPADADLNTGMQDRELFRFVETTLLVLSCIWIIYEAVRRLFFTAARKLSQHSGLYRNVLLHCGGLLASAHQQIA